jgi:cystathionine beta-lyase/cystathionine gamma-synthase
LAAVEGSKFAYSFASGLAAESAILQALLTAGDEVIVCDDLYGGSGRLFRTLFAKFNIQFHFVDFADEAALKDAKNSKTKMIWVETPSNPMMKLIDIAKIRQTFKDCIVVVDNTFASPFSNNH